jgi:SAM-dependent methyltransferase
MGRNIEASAAEWDNHYDRGQVSWQSSGLSPHVKKYLERYAIGAELLEIGCGTGEDTKDLLSLGYQYCGLDLSAQATALAKSAHLEGNSLFITADFFRWQTSRKFSVIYDKGTFHNLSGPERRLEFAKRAADLLKHAGIWVTVCGSADNYDLKVPHGAIFLQHLIAPVETYFEALEVIKAPYGTAQKSLDFPAWHCVFRRR